MRCTWFVILCAVGIALCIEHDFKGFDDSILFGLQWPGSLQDIVEGENTSENEIKIPEPNKEVIVVKTSHREEYQCSIPELKDKENRNSEDYTGASPINLLKPLFSQKICSYRLESYWSYEVCHGRFIRQYHEEREGKQVKTQEYYLGHWGLEKQVKLENDAKASEDTKASLKTTKVDGQDLPYVEMVMDEGTICDLSGKPRVTKVLYVCYSHGKHEVYSFKETSTCEYEIIILSPLLCEHPQFKPKEVKENIIECRPLLDHPKKPRNLLKMEAESLKFHHQSIRIMGNDNEPKDILAVLKVEKVDKDGETTLKFELQPLEDTSEFTEEAPKRPLLDKPPVISDDSPVRAFLNGDNCLSGGAGWWKYEFCYGKHVVQYHIDRTGEKTTLLLGQFDEQTHIDWVKTTKGKAPKPLEMRTSISHFYSNGDICDKTGKPRQTEVKLKCPENSSSPAQVALYLLEPRMCHYILGVESPLICDILPLADEHGLIKSNKPLFTTQDSEVTAKEENEAEPKVEPKFGND